MKAALNKRVWHHLWSGGAFFGVPVAVVVLVLIVPVVVAASSKRGESTWSVLERERAGGGAAGAPASSPEGKGGGSAAVGAAAGEAVDAAAGDARDLARLRSLAERIAALDRRIAATTDVNERMALAAERAKLARAHAFLYQRIREEDLRRQQQSGASGYADAISGSVAAAAGVPGGAPLGGDQRFGQGSSPGFGQGSGSGFGQGSGFGPGGSPASGGSPVGGGVQPQRPSPPLGIDGSRSSADLKRQLSELEIQVERVRAAGMYRDHPAVYREQMEMIAQFRDYIERLERYERQTGNVGGGGTVAAGPRSDGTVPRSQVTVTQAMMQSYSDGYAYDILTLLPRPGGRTSGDFCFQWGLPLAQARSLLESGFAIAADRSALRAGLNPQAVISWRRYRISPGQQITMGIEFHETVGGVPAGYTPYRQSRP